MPNRRYPEPRRSQAAPQVPGSSGRGPTGPRDSRKRVNVSLAPAAIEGIGASAELEPQRDRAELEVPAHGVDQIAAIALGQLVGAVAEDHEGWRAGFHLGDVAQLDPLPARRRRRVGLDSGLEPAVELACRHAPRPGLAKIECDLDDGVDAFARFS